MLLEECRIAHSTAKSKFVRVISFTGSLPGRVLASLRLRLAEIAKRKRQSLNKQVELFLECCVSFKSQHRRLAQEAGAPQGKLISPMSETSVVLSTGAPPKTRSWSGRGGSWRGTPSLKEQN